MPISARIRVTGAAVVDHTRRMLIGSAVSLSFTLATPPSATAQDTSLVSLRSEELARAKSALQRGDSTLRPALDRLLADADRALTAGPFSVTEKRRIPPSRDPHDYMSLAPYWWPDSTSPNGLPYVRRDGVRNPDTEKDYDSPRLKRMGDAVTTLALAYYFTGREPYAERAAQLLHVWFVAPATRMNPSLTYAQAIPGITDGRGIGIIETRGLIRLLDALRMLERSSSWKRDDRRETREWMGAYLDWLLTSPNGRDELAAKNNHGSWYDAQTAALALFLGRSELTRRIVEASKARRIAVQITPDGRQPLEETRTRSLDYSIFNLEALMQLAELGAKVGVELWHYQASSGGSIRKALAYLAAYADPAKKWEGEQITAIDATRMLEVLRVGELVFNDATCTALIARMPADRVRVHRVQLLYPPHA
jgi:Alginate lyase